MDKFLENLKLWFEGLSEQPQILSSFENFVSWITQLSLNQQLVLLGALIIVLLLLYFLLKLSVFTGRRIRKWIRRKRMSAGINLHLNREQEDLKYGTELRNNIQKMKNEAPFRKDTSK